MQISVLEAGLDRKRLQDTLKKLIKRHESLRTSFQMVAGEVVQVVHEQDEMGLEFEYMEYNGADENTVKKLTGEFVRAFDLSKAPLFRMELLKAADSRFILMTDLHHIITDGVSMSILQTDFLMLYTKNELPGTMLQYRDYSQWQNRVEQKNSLEKQEQYWLSRFAGEIPLLNMPTDYPRLPGPRFQGDDLHFEIDRELTAQLRELAEETDVTMYMLLLAAYNILLFKYSGQEVIIVGSPASCRTNASLHQIIGLFANMLVMKNMPNRDKTFQQFLEEVKQHALQAFENQDYPFNELVEKLDIPRTRDRHPLIDTVFTFQSERKPGEYNQALANIKTIPYEFHFKEIQHELLLSAVENHHNITLLLQYSTMLFKESTAKKISRHYIEILEQIIQDPYIVLKNIKISIHMVPVSIENEKEQGDFCF